MRKRGQKFLTRLFLLLTGAVVTVLLLGILYILLDFEVSLLHLIAIPILFLLPIVFYRVMKEARATDKLDRLLVWLRVPLLLRLLQVPRLLAFLERLKRLAKKLLRRLKF